MTAYNCLQTLPEVPEEGARNKTNLENLCSEGAGRLRKEGRRGLTGLWRTRLRSTSTEFPTEELSVQDGFGVNAPCEMGLVDSCQGMAFLLLSPVLSGGEADF